MIDLYPDFCGMYIEGDTGWFISRVDNILYQINVSNREITFLAELPEHGRDNFRGNSLCCKYKDYIVCIPNRINYLYLYNLLEKRFENIEMPQRNGFTWMYPAYILRHEFLYMISPSEKKIVVADLDSLRIVKTISLNQYQDEISVKGAVVYGTSIFYIAEYKETAIYEFDSINESISFISKIDSKGKYATITFDGESFWLSGSKVSLLLVNKQTKEQKTISLASVSGKLMRYNFRGLLKDENSGLYIENEDEDDGLFAITFVWKNKVWFIPFVANYIIYVDLSNNAIMFIELENEQETIESIRNRGFLRSYKYFFERFENDNKLVVYSVKNDCHYVINGDTGKCIETFKDYKINNYSQLMERICLNNLILSECSPTDCEIFKYKIFKNA